MDSSPENSGESTSPGLHNVNVGGSRGSSLASPGPAPHLPSYGMINQNHCQTFAYDNPMSVYSPTIINSHLNMPTIKFESSYRMQTGRIDSCAIRDNVENHAKEFIENNRSNGRGSGRNFTLKQVICICEVLMKSKSEESISQLEQFLLDLPRDLHGGLEAVIRAKISVLFHRETFGEMYKMMQSYEFSPEYHEELQKLWYLAHYKEQEKIRGRSLGAVDKYRLRRKYPLLKTFWDGEETVYCFKQKSRSALKDFYKKNPYPTQDEKKALAKEVKLTSMQVSNWFKNKRQRDKSRKLCDNNQLPNSGHSPGSVSHHLGHGHEHTRISEIKNAIIYDGSTVVKYPDEIGVGTSGSVSGSGGVIMAHLRQPISLSMKGGPAHEPGSSIEIETGGPNPNSLTQHQLNSITTAIRSSGIGQHHVNIMENSGNGNYGGNISVIQQLQAGGHYYQHPAYEGMTSIQHSTTHSHSIPTLSY